jgi:hypothetical protein
MVESRNAPNLPARPCWRAIDPSSMSVKAKTVAISVAMIRCPRAAKTTALTTTPRVPATVTASGEMCSRSRPRAIGSNTRVNPARPNTLKIFAMALSPYPRRRCRPTAGPRPVRRPVRRR